MPACANAGAADGSSSTAGAKIQLVWEYKSQTSLRAVVDARTQVLDLP